MVKVKISDWKADSSMDEAYKALRTNIQFCGADKKVIAFTSCTPTELLPAPFIFLIYCPRFTSRFVRDAEPSDRLPSRHWRDRQAAGFEISPAPIAQARPTQNDWLSSLTKSSDVNRLARRKHARIARRRNFQVAHFNKKHATVC